MSDTDFLNSNMLRSFPFIHNPRSVIADWLIADFRAVILQGDWKPSEHRIYLAWVALNGDRLRFGFRTDAPELMDEELVFERSLTDGRYLTEFVQSTPLAETYEDRCGCSEELLCDPILTGPEDGDCGPELLCSPELTDSCKPELLCDVELLGNTTTAE